MDSWLGNFIYRYFFLREKNLKIWPSKMMSWLLVLFRIFSVAEWNLHLDGLFFFLISLFSKRFGMSDLGALWDKRSRGKLIVILLPYSGPWCLFFGDSRGWNWLLGGSIFRCHRPHGRWQECRGSKGCRFWSDRGRFLLQLRGLPWSGVLDIKSNTFEVGEILCCLEVANVESSSSLRGINDAAVVFGVDLSWHFRNNL